MYASFKSHQQGQSVSQSAAREDKNRKSFFCSLIGVALICLSLSFLVNLSFSSRTVTAIAEARSPAVDITQSERSRIELHNKYLVVEWNHNDYLSRNPFKRNRLRNDI